MKIEWGIRYGTVVSPPHMDGTAVETKTYVVNDEDRARSCVDLGLPLSGFNHRAVFRYVTEWELAP